MSTLLFGDSIAKGITYNNQRLQMTDMTPIDYLKRDYGIEVNSFATYGQTLIRLDQKEIIKKEIAKLDLNQEHYVILAIGGNDADYDWATVSKSPLKHHEPKTPLIEFEKLLTYYVSYLKSLGIKVMLFTTVPLISKRYFEEVICKMADKEAILTFFNQDIEMISRHQEAYSHVIAKIAYQYNSILVDIRTKLLHNSLYNDYLSKDGVHPNQKGYDLIYQIIQEGIENNPHLIEWKCKQQKENPTPYSTNNRILSNIKLL
jgi:acyl-CoA thioesterase-1